MSWPESFFFPHRVLVEALQAGAGMGTTYAPAREVIAEVLDEVELVRDANAQEVVSSARVTVPLSAAVPVGSRVTVWPGTAQQRKATVLTVARDENPPPLPSHLILRLT